MFLISKRRSEKIGNIFALFTKRLEVWGFSLQSLSEVGSLCILTLLKSLKFYIVKEKETILSV